MARQENRVNRETAFKVYEWVASKKDEIAQGKWTLAQVAQFAGEQVGHLIPRSTIAEVLKFQNITIPTPKQPAKGVSWMATKIKELEERLANLERQLGLKAVA